MKICELTVKDTKARLQSIINSLNEFDENTKCSIETGTNCDNRFVVLLSVG